MKDRDSLTIRSFRVVFRLERRIHKVDRWRIPVPHGVPLRGIGYWAAALAVTIVLARLPIVGELIGALPTPIRLAVAPVAVAYLLAQVEVDGRSAHVALGAWARLKLSPSRIAGLKAVQRPGSVVRLADVTIAPDECSARYRSAVIRGPASVRLRYPPFGQIKRGRRRASIHVWQLPGPPLSRARAVRIGQAQRMVVHG